MKKLTDETRFALHRRRIAAIAFAALTFIFVAAKLLPHSDLIVLSLLFALLPNLPLLFSAARFWRDPVSTQSIAWAGLSVTVYGYWVCCLYYAALLSGWSPPSLEGWSLLLPCSLAFGVPTAVLAGTSTTPRQLLGLTPLLMFLALGVAVMILPMLMG